MTGNFKMCAKRAFECVIIAYCFAMVCFFVETLAKATTSQVELLWSPQDNEFVAKHKFIYALACLFTLLPFIFAFCVFIAVPTRLFGSIPWAATGASVGLVVSFLWDPSNFWIQVFIGLQPGFERHVKLASVGLGLALFFSGRRFEFPATAEDASDSSDLVNSNPQSDATTSNSDDGSDRSLVSSVLMLWMVSAFVIGLGGGYLGQLLSTPLSEIDTRDRTKAGVSIAWLLAMWGFGARNCLSSGRVMAWNYACAITLGTITWMSLRFTGSQVSSSQSRVEEWTLLTFVAHVGNLLGFFSRHNLAARRFYRALGIQYPVKSVKQEIVTKTGSEQDS